MSWQEQHLILWIVMYYSQRENRGMILGGLTRGGWGFFSSNYSHLASLIQDQQNQKDEVLIHEGKREGPGKTVCSAWFRRTWLAGRWRQWKWTLQAASGTSWKSVCTPGEDWFTGEKHFETVTNQRRVQLAVLGQMSQNHLFATPTNLALKKGVLTRV